MPDRLQLVPGEPGPIVVDGHLLEALEVTPPIDTVLRAYVDAQPVRDVTAIINGTAEQRASYYAGALTAYLTVFVGTDPDTITAYAVALAEREREKRRE